jgi:hypothetical protein
MNISKNCHIFRDIGNFIALGINPEASLKFRIEALSMFF